MNINKNPKQYYWLWKMGLLNTELERLKTPKSMLIYNTIPLVAVNGIIFMVIKCTGMCSASFSTGHELDPRQQRSTCFKKGVSNSQNLHTVTP